jgi:hypothetical protein
MVGLRIYSGTQDLHDPGHLFTWLGTHSDKDAIAMYKAHPELMHVKNARNLTAFMREMLAALVNAGANRHYHDCQGFGWMHYAVTRTYLLCDEVLASGGLRSLPSISFFVFSRFFLNGRLFLAGLVGKISSSLFTASSASW